MPSFASTASSLPPHTWHELSTVRPCFLWDRGRSVTQIGQSEYLFSWVQQLVHRLAEDPSRMNQSPVSVIDMGTREERGPFSQLLSIRAIQAWNFPWVSLPSNAGTCWEWHCAEKKQSQERKQRWRESWWWNCWNAGSSHFWNPYGFPRVWAMLRKSLVERLYILIYWFNLPGDGVLLLKTRVLYNIFECFTDMFAVNMDYSRVLWSCVWGEAEVVFL